MTTKIEWTNQTWNPVTGCSRVSPGCDHCYMFALYPRLKGMSVPGYSDTPDTISMMPERLSAPLSWKKPRLVFVNSMSDLFHAHVDDGFIGDVFETISKADAHAFQILTKRPGRAVGWWNRYGEARFGEWPANAWIGTSVENQKYAPRLSVLRRLPAPMKFVSAEPLLDRLDLSEWLDDETLQWVIVGGESGRGARLMDEDWARQLRDQTKASELHFFLKQMGGYPNKRGGDSAELDGRTWHEIPPIPNGGKHG